MKRLIPSAYYRPNDHSHDHQDPDMAKSMIIDIGLKAGARISKLEVVGNELAAVVRMLVPDAVALREWEQVVSEPKSELVI